MIWRHIKKVTDDSMKKKFEKGENTCKNKGEHRGISYTLINYSLRFASSKKKKLFIKVLSKRKTYSLRGKF